MGEKAERDREKTKKREEKTYAHEYYSFIVFTHLKEDRPWLGVYYVVIFY